MGNTPTGTEMRRSEIDQNRPALIVDFGGDAPQSQIMVQTVQNLIAKYGLLNAIGTGEYFPPECGNPLIIPCHRTDENDFGSWRNLDHAELCINTKDNIRDKKTRLTQLGKECGVEILFKDDLGVGRVPTETDVETEAQQITVVFTTDKSHSEVMTEIVRELITEQDLLDAIGTDGYAPTGSETPVIAPCDRTDEMTVGTWHDLGYRGMCLNTKYPLQTKLARLKQLGEECEVKISTVGARYLERVPVDDGQSGRIGPTATAAKTQRVPTLGVDFTGADPQSDVMVQAAELLTTEHGLIDAIGTDEYCPPECEKPLIIPCEKTDEKDFGTWHDLGHSGLCIDTRVELRDKKTRLRQLGAECGVEVHFDDEYDIERVPGSAETGKQEIENSADDAVAKVPKSIMEVDFVPSKSYSQVIIEAIQEMSADHDLLDEIDTDGYIPPKFDEPLILPSQEVAKRASGTWKPLGYDSLFFNTGFSPDDQRVFLKQLGDECGIEIHCKDVLPVCFPSNKTQSFVMVETVQEMITDHNLLDMIDTNEYVPSTSKKSLIVPYHRTDKKDYGSWYPLGHQELCLNTAYSFSTKQLRLQQLGAECGVDVRFEE